MIWLGCVIVALLMGIAGCGWFWLLLALVGALADVGWARPIKDRERMERRISRL
jgi:hypothetical protein